MKQIIEKRDRFGMIDRTETWDYAGKTLTVKTSHGKTTKFRLVVCPKTWKFLTELIQ